MQCNMLGPALELSMVPAPKLFAQQPVIVVMLIVVMLSCLGDLPAAAVGSPVLFLAQTLLLIFQSIVQSMVQSRVQSPAFALTPFHPHEDEYR